MTILFKTKPDELKRSIRRAIRLTKHEDDQLIAAARLKQLSITEYLIKAALGKRTDSHHDREALETLRLLAHYLRETYKMYEQEGIIAPLELIPKMHDDIADAISKLGEK